VGSNQQGKVTDRRPVTEKSTQVKYGKHIVKYLTQRGYNKPISPKILSSPTNKDFFSIVLFLYQNIDPNYQFGQKPEEDVQFIFKSLKYPTPINKSALIAVGSPHTWPHLLAAIHWLMELILHDEIVASKETPEGLGREGDNPGEKLFLDYLGKAYQSYLAGEDNFSALECELSSTLQAKTNHLQGTVKELQDSIASLNAEVTALRTAPNRVEELEKRISDYKSDLQKFEQVCVDLDNYKAALEKKISEQRDELQVAEAEFESLSAEKEECAAILEEQDEKDIDAERIAKDKEKLEDAQKHATSLRIAAEQTTWEIETRLNKRLEEVEKAVAAYNTAAAELGIVPSTAKYAEGKELAIEFFADTQSLSVDLKLEAKPLLNRLKDRFVASFNKSQTELLNLQEKKERKEETVNDRLDDLRGLQNKLKTEQSVLQAQKEEADAELEKIVEETEAMLREVQRLRQASNASLVQSQRSLQSIEEQCVEMQSRYTQEKDLLCKQILTIVDTLVTHKAFVQERLQAVAEKYTSDAKIICSSSSLAATTTTSSKAQQQ